ncbi:MAG: segregation/condensation protein A [Nitriliruptorales bacterium]|nr:segregation/condensation protein A [Nitriliruptorales bacterium]
MPGTYHVTVASFEGPFDLLLHLIARHKVDIYEIPLAQITDDYLAVLREMDRVDLDVATEFLVVAATLIELKAARLLPDEDDPEIEDLALEARDLLYARLLDYRMFKEASSYLARRLESMSGYVARAVPLEERFTDLIPHVNLGITPDALAGIAARALAAKPEPVVDISHLQPVRMTVREAAGMVVQELGRAGGAATFTELTAGCRHPVEVIVHFLALLELFKLDLIDLDQTANFSTLRVTANPEVAWETQVLREMEEYVPVAPEDPDEQELTS